MKKKISLLLAALMLLGTAPAFAAGGKTTPRIPLQSKGTIIRYYNGSAAYTGTAIDLSSASYAQRFTAEGKLTMISMNCPSYSDNIGSVTFRLYQWNKDYKTTVAGKVIAQKTFVDFDDNELLEMAVPGNYSGEFLLVFADPVQRVGAWTNPSSNTVSKEDVLYINGEPKPGTAVNLSASVSPSLAVESIQVEPVDAYSNIDLSKPHQSSQLAFSTYEGDGFAYLDKSDVGLLVYRVDFGSSSPKGATLRTRNVVTDASKIQIIADDPDNGPIICEFYAEVGEELTFWQTLTSKMHHELTGVHDIYIILQYSNIYMFDLVFHHEKPELSWDEKRLADFEATKDFTLKDTYSDTWAGNDLLGRKLTNHETAGDFNPDKQVGIFYWTWHSGRGQNNSYSINQRVIDSYNGPESEIKNDFNYKGWGNGGVWNESIYGIYSGFDHWVMRKHMELLSAAGVDGLFFDATNGTNVWTGGYMELAHTIHQMHLEGSPTPKISFMLPFFDMDYNVTDLERIYESMYSIGLYSDAWYYWDGKPVVMGYPNRLIEAAHTDEIKAQHEEILDFFTFRPGQPDYRKGLYQENQWPWLEIYPQHAYGESEKYGCETVSVGVAQNASDLGLVAMNGKDVYGRSFTYKNRFNKLSPTSKYYGYNFIEQWDRAFELDPEFVFVTGWNEWTAGHYDSWGADKATGAFPDQYSDEYSRDCEPTKGEFKDTYYLLLANKIRQFKGVRPTPTASEEKTIDLSAGFAQWENVGPEYFGFKGGVETRDAYLRQGHVPIKNETGRNDIVLSKVARDAENLYFYVQTADDLTPHTDESWMRLFINTDRGYKTGWEGYDFILNRVSPTENKAVLEKWTGKYVTDWKFEKVAEVDYTYKANEMMIKIPKALLGVGDAIDIEFKWNDNMQQQGDIMDFYVNGDTAPVSRYAYRYVDEASVKNQVKDEPIDPATTLPHITRRFVTMAIGNNQAYVYGQKIPIDTQSDVTAPVIINGKTMIPVRFLAESIGATVTWTEATQEIKIMGNKRIFLNLGSNIMRVEKEKRTLQTPAMEIEGRTYVPLRDIVEALDISCFWVEPGLILCGPEEGYVEAMANGGIDRLLVEFGLLTF